MKRRARAPRAGTIVRAPAERPVAAPTRRAFLAFASTAALGMFAGVAEAATAAKKPAAPRKGATAKRSASMQAEIDSQKASVARALAKIRAHPLPAGSDPAFVFSPLPPRRAPAQNKR